VLLALGDALVVRTRKAHAARVLLHAKTPEKADCGPPFLVFSSDRNRAVHGLDPGHDAH
jgi:hypothetical protein